MTDHYLSQFDLEDDNKMISSHVAARINGYVGGYGDEVSNTVGIPEIFFIYSN